LAPALPRGGDFTGDPRIGTRGARLERCGIVYGYCGQIRPSKGVEDLIVAFRALPDPSARLLVAGLPVYQQEMVEILTQLAGDDPRICLRLRDLTVEDFRASIGVCDLVVAPFRSYLHSGSLVHALSCHRPVLTPATPFATSLATHLASPGWVQTYEGALTPAVLAAAVRPQAPLDLAPLDPSLAAIRIVEFLERLIGIGARTLQAIACRHRHASSPECRKMGLGRGIPGICGEPVQGSGMNGARPSPIVRAGETRPFWYCVRSIITHSTLCVWSR
jgi:glycosyltransferase involved in cell wall biosynthesis